jgi:TonB-linked SusC/RagA family outer membrane protein
MIMRLTTVILILTLMQASATGFAQRISMSRLNAPLKTIMKEIKAQTGFNFICTDNLLKKAKPVSISFKDVELEDALKQIFEEQPLSYAIDSKTIVVREKERPSFLERIVDAVDNIRVSGRVTDSDGKPLIGATVTIEGSSHFVKTNEKGEFIINNVDEKSVLKISFVGYQSKQIRAARDLGIIQLIETTSNLKEVYVSTGMFDRKKSSFTGATSTFSGEQLRNIGNINILQSLKSLDPSFIIVDNNLLGSNPNQIPQIELRGTTSIGTSTDGLRDEFSNDPNQPLFVLDGMETTLSRIIDLDINRVKSVTILKDAASTALYGSKAANGVVVVETIRPVPGELRISYSASGTFEAPDLSSYNMMNAAELLEFQRLSGMYKPNSTVAGFVSQDLYNKRLMEVQKGVNSYWLNTPLRNAFNVGHSLNISGGDQKLTYSVGGNYRDYKGVMIGSNKTTWSGNTTLNYRKGNINVQNMLSIDGTKSNESPYGSFSEYVKLSPFYRKRNESGDLNTNKYLEEYYLATDMYQPTLYTTPNPMYNATLNARNRAGSTSITNNLNLLWDIASSLRISAGFQLNKGNSESEVYTPALNTTFDDTVVLEKGRYDVGNGSNFGYQANAGITYNKVIKEHHSINWNFRGSIQEASRKSLSTIMIGFPAGVEPIPTFAYSYLPNAKPSGRTIKTRGSSLLTSFNYSYKGKYNFDATYNLDGSNSFGSEKLFTPFWSAGIGWNIDRESFFHATEWVDQLRLRGNIGVNGNQGFGQFLSSSSYLYENNTGMFGQALYVDQLGNPLLDWQKTTQTSLGLDISLFKKRVVLTVNTFNKKTDPLIVGISLPASTGLNSFFDNVGSLQSRGVEVNLLLNIINAPEKGINWSVGLIGGAIKNKYSGLTERMKNFNAAAQKSNSLLRYYDGYSPDDIWAVRSLGIDPAGGQEVFLTKNNEKVYQWNSDYIVRVGNSRPLGEGVLNTNLGYKGFWLGLYFRYRFGASFMNQALYQKVENISFDNLANNQDKRALYERWKTPGDRASFRAISTTSETPMSSRFIQKENSISAESINISYSFSKSDHPWMAKLKLQGLRLSATTNNIFRLSNIQLERGLNYPFASSTSFNINVSF